MTSLSQTSTLWQNTHLGWKYMDCCQPNVFGLGDGLRREQREYLLREVLLLLHLKIRL